MNRIEEVVEMQLPLIEARKAGQVISHEYILNNISYLVELYEEREDWPAAMKTRQKVYKSRKRLDPDSPRTLHQASRIAMLYEYLLDWGRVIELRRDKVKAWRRIEGSDSNNALLAQVEVGSGLEKLGRYNKAKSVIDEAIERRSKTLRPYRFGTLAALRVKATICRSLEEFDESEQILNGVLSTRAQYPMEDSTCCRALAGLSKVYKAQGQSDRALELLREAVDACEGPQGDEYVVRPEDLLPDLAKEYGAVQRWEEAEKILDQALLKLRSRQATRATSRKIEECIALLREVCGRENQIESGAARTPNLCS